MMTTTPAIASPMRSVMDRSSQNPVQTHHVEAAAVHEQQDCHQAPKALYPVLAVCALGVAGATAVGLRWAARPQSVKTITMGPGGWVSFKGLKPPPLAPRRPWWAVALRAQPVHAHHG